MKLARMVTHRVRSILAWIIALIIIGLFAAGGYYLVFVLGVAPVW